MRSSLALALLLLLVNAEVHASGPEGTSHGHEEHEEEAMSHDSSHALQNIEWIGEFDFGAGVHTLVLSKVKGAYAAPSVAIVAMKMEKGGLEAVEEVMDEEMAHHEEFQKLFQGEMLSLMKTAAPATFSLMMDVNASVTVFKINVVTPGSYAIASQHMISEFEGGLHYLQSPLGEDIFPISVHGGEVCTSNKLSTHQIWGYSFAGAIMGALMSLSGALLLIPLLLKGGSFRFKHTNIINAFAAGVLLGLVFLHLVPESISLAGVSWQPWTMIVAGFLVGLCTEHVLSALGFAHAHSGHSHHHAHEHSAVEGELALQHGNHAHTHAHQHSGHSHADTHTRVRSDLPLKLLPTMPQVQGPYEIGSNSYTDGFIPSTASSVVDEEARQAHRPSLKVVDVEAGQAPRLSLMGRFLGSSVILNILVGDFFHNLFDGIAIGTAFRACGDMGWVVSASVIVHELPQEISDFAILVRAGLPVPYALLANLCSSLSSLLGVLIALIVGQTADAVGLDNSLGLLLAFSAGILLYVATGLMHEVVETKSKFISVACWVTLIVGVIIMGLLKMWHPHCESCGNSGGQDGHNQEGQDGHNH